MLTENKERVCVVFGHPPGLVVSPEYTFNRQKLANGLKEIDNQARRQGHRLGEPFSGGKGSVEVALGLCGGEMNLVCKDRYPRPAEICPRILYSSRHRKPEVGTAKNNSV